MKKAMAIAAVILITVGIVTFTSHTTVKAQSRFHADPIVGQVSPDGSTFTISRVNADGSTQILAITQSISTASSAFTDALQSLSVQAASGH